MTGDAQPRSARKRTAILDAATTVFLRKGYLGTSMDEIAALAAVSKQTVYKHFADKERLFAEIVIGTVDEASDRVGDEVARPPRHRGSRGRPARPRPPPARDGHAAAAPRAPPTRDRRGRPLPRARPHVLRARAGPDRRRARGRLRAPRRARPPATSTTRAARHSTSTGWSCRSPINQAMLLGDDGRATPPTSTATRTTGCARSSPRTGRADPRRVRAATATTPAAPDGQGPAMAGFLLGAAAMFATMYSTQAILPELGRAFGVSPSRAGLSVAVVIGAVAVGGWLWGPVSDRIGRRRAITVASGLLIVPTALLALAPSFGVLLALRALQGLCMPGLLTVGVPYVAEVFAPAIGGRAMGAYTAALVGGGLVGRVGVGLLHDGRGLAARAGRPRAAAAGRHPAAAPHAARGAAGGAGHEPPPRAARAPRQPRGVARDRGRRGDVLRVRRHVHLHRLPARGAALRLRPGGHQPALRAVGAGRGGPHGRPARGPRRLARGGGRGGGARARRARAVAAGLAAGDRGGARPRHARDVLGRPRRAAGAQRGRAHGPRGGQRDVLHRLLSRGCARVVGARARVGGVGMAGGRRGGGRADRRGPGRRYRPGMAFRLTGLPPAPTSPG